MGKKVTGTTKQRRFFETELAAKEFIDGLRDTVQRKGKAAFSIEDALAHEALALTKELKPFNVGLTQAVRFHQTCSQTQQCKRQWNQDGVFADKTNEKVPGAQEMSLNVFDRDFGNKPVAGIFSNALPPFPKTKRSCSLSPAVRVSQYRSIDWCPLLRLKVCPLLERMVDAVRSDWPEIRRQANLPKHIAESIDRHLKELPLAKATR